MSQSTTQNRRWVLASRPHGAPVADNFRLEEQPIPAPAEGQVLYAPYGSRLIRTCEAV